MTCVLQIDSCSISQAVCSCGAPILQDAHCLVKVCVVRHCLTCALNAWAFSSLSSTRLLNAATFLLGRIGASVSDAIFAYNKK